MFASSLPAETSVLEGNRVLLEVTTQDEEVNICIYNIYIYIYLSITLGLGVTEGNRVVLEVTTQD